MVGVKFECLIGKLFVVSREYKLKRKISESSAGVETMTFRAAVGCRSLNQSYLQVNYGETRGKRSIFIAFELFYDLVR